MSRIKYDDSFPQRAYQLAREGFTDAQIAVRLGVSPSTFFNYRLKYRDFLEALAEGRNELDLNVENRLMDLVLGRCKVTTTVTDDLGRTKTTTRTVPPNLKAVIYWLEKRVYVRDQPPGEIAKQKNEEETKRYIREMMTFAGNGCRDVAVKLTVDDGDDIEEREFVLGNSTWMLNDTPSTPSVELERGEAVMLNDTPSTPSVELERGDAAMLNDTPSTPSVELERGEAVVLNDTPSTPSVEAERGDAAMLNDTPSTPSTPGGDADEVGYSSPSGPSSPLSPSDPAPAADDEPDEWIDGRLPGPRKPVRRTTQFSLVDKF